MLQESKIAEEDDLISAEESGALVERSASTIWRRAARGDLEAVIVGGRTRFRRGDVLKLLEPRPRPRSGPTRDNPSTETDRT